MATAAVKPGAVEKVNALFDAGHFIAFWTSRTHRMRQVTNQWLWDHGFKYHDLLMDKPRGGNYIWIDNLDVEFFRATEELWNGDLEIVQKYRRGQIVKQKGQTCVIVGLPGDPVLNGGKPGDTVPDGHVALWYGETNHNIPQVWTVPADVVEPGSENWDVFH